MRAKLLNSKINSKKDGAGKKPHKNKREPIAPYGNITENNR